ncbi:small ribosomal subunit Rsm22 family protein [Halonotius sp. GCM10025705]|uniref:small ribosomal subunit Rsm22 family protein n=1 Tax=Halonotius sp. GCM10025705 TaxID=3252678 RepID=UPI0036080316
MIDREAVRSNAKYLQQVRPIDPDEIAEYIDGQPHPAVVAQTLREEAFDLGLIERADGTFVPLESEAIPHREWSPAALPAAYSRAVEDFLVKQYGANWHLGESGTTLRSTIRTLKADYLTGDDIEYDTATAAGYAIYHLPAYYATIGYVLATLTERGLLPASLRVLDVGAGVGGPALGLHDFVFGDADDREPTAGLVDYHAVEPSAAADVLDRVLSETSRNFRSTIHRSTIETFDYDAGDTNDDPFDLLIFGNVCNELDDPVAVVEDSLSHLADDGTVLLLEPADRNTAIELREIERAIAGGDTDATVYAPTLRLWDGAEPDDRGWSFDVRPEIAVPAFQDRLAEAAAEADEDDPDAFRNVDVQFAYSLLRRDDERRYPFRASRDRHAKMAAMDDHVTERIDLLAVKLSHDLSDGDNAVFKIGDGSQTTDHYAVVTKESGLNRALASADYGAVLAFENALVLWNDDEEAYNLVVDGETVVDQVSG